MTEVVQFRQIRIASNDMETGNVLSTANALGVKWAREAATIAATPAVLDAALSALLHGYGINHMNMPATRYAFRKAIRAVKANAA